MNLPKAIEIAKEFEPGMAIPYGQDTKDAIKLLIEAGKHLQYERDRRIGFWTDKIPGED